MNEDRILQVLHPIGHLIHQREVVVHQRVEQRMHQGADFVAQWAVRRLPARQRLVDVPDGARVHGHQVVGADEQVDDLRLDVIFFGVVVSRVEHDEVVAVVGIHLGALVGTRGVLDGQRMKVEFVAQQRGIFLRWILDVQPEHACRIGQGRGQCRRVQARVE